MTDIEMQAFDKPSCLPVIGICGFLKTMEWLLVEPLGLGFIVQSPLHHKAPHNKALYRLEQDKLLCLGEAICSSLKDIQDVIVYSPVCL